MASSRLGCNDGLMLAGRMRDRREQSRLRTARLVQVAHEGDAAYARCRDFSDSGMKLDLTAPLELNDSVAVALTPSIILFGRVAWVNGRECGIAFDGPVDSEALLDRADAARDAAEGPTTLEMLNGRQGAALAPAPPTNGRYRSGAQFEPGLAVTVMAGSNHEQRAVVRWAKGNIAELELTPHGQTERRQKERRAQRHLLTGPE